MNRDDMILENLPDYAFDLLDAAQQLLSKLDDINTTDFANGGDQTERETLRSVVRRITGETTFTPQLTPTQYAKRSGDYCPVCMSTSLVCEPAERPQDGKTQRGVGCRSCVAHWVEVYRLEGYRDLET